MEMIIFETVGIIIVIAGVSYGVWEMCDIKKNPEKYDYVDDSEEGFDRGYYRQRKGMFDNFR